MTRQTCPRLPLTTCFSNQYFCTSVGNGHATVLRRAAGVPHPLPPLPPPLGRKPPPPPGLYEEPNHSSDSDFGHQSNRRVSQPPPALDRLSVRSGLHTISGAGSRKPLLSLTPGEESGLFAEDQVTSPHMLYFAPQLGEVQGSDHEASPGLPGPTQAGIQVQF